MKMYAWIAATAVSRTVSITAVGIMISCDLISIDIMKFLSRFISRCPASMLAVIRTLSVIGRMMILVNSIITIVFIKVGGVP